MHFSLALNTFLYDYPDVDGGDESEDSDDPASFTRETQFLVGEFIFQG